jgi:uncharacterized protein
MLKLLRLALPAVLLCGFGAPALAQTIPLTGGTYSQDFDTLANTGTTNSTLPTGWLLNETGGGARDNEQYAADTGGSNTGDAYSYGAAASTERAFGSLRSGTLIAVIGACFTNATGNTLTSVDVAYTGEEWRLGTAARTDQIDFQYSLNATSLTTGTWVDVNALDFVSPNTATTGAKDGNAAGNRTALAATIGSLNIANSASFCIRWNDADASGADDGLSIDDVSITVGGSASPVVSVNDATLQEGNSGTSPMFFAFGLSQAAGPGGVSIQYTTADGTATAGSDYVAGSGTLTIPEGSNSVAFSITINGDTTTEADETFFVNIVSATGATVVDGQGQGTIQNDDVNVVPISQIQGSGLVSPLNGAAVVTEGIVTAQKFNNGFFLQTADANADADPNTSEGIFVFTSTAPPATAAVGNRIRVAGTVTEFTPSTNLNQLSITEIVSVTSIQVLSTGNALPAPVVLTSADFNDASTPGTAEKYEGMRVSAANARTTTGSDGNITESSATATTTGVFYIVLSGVARPFREEGIDILDQFPIPGGKTPPRFDHNPERIMVRSRAQIGATAVALDAETTIDSMVGVMDYFSGAWAVLPDPVGGLVVSGGKIPTAVSTPGYADVSIGAFNLLRFFDEVNNSNGAPTLTAAALDKRLTKTSLAICDFLKTPDILGVVEVENLRVLGLLADRINSTCASAPAYVPYLVQGNDVGGINVGFLVSNRSLGTVSRVEVLEVTQFGKDTLLSNPDGSTSLLNDRPPLMLRAIVHSGTGSTYPITAYINHLRSLNGVGDAGPGSSGWPTENARVSAKRTQQAAFLANLVHARQVADPNEHIVLLGDFNAFEFSDGYADVMGIVSGAPEPESQVITYLPSPITVPLLNGNSLTPNKADRYSYLFDGNLQTLDHVVINEAAVMTASDMEVDHARINAEFGEHNFGVAGTALRVSDHDPVRIRITPASFRRVDLGVTASATPPSVAVGGTANFTATASNAGPGDAEFASIALVFNALVSPTVTPAANWTCAAPIQAATTTTVTCTTANFANGGSATFTAAVVTGANLAGQTLQMAAAVTSQVTDSANGNNSAIASVSVFVTGNANLSTGLLGGPNGPTGIGSVGPIVQGGAATFVVPVRNAGPNAALAPTLVLTGDTALFDTFIEIPAGWTCTESGDDDSYRYDCTAANSLRNRTNVYFSLTVFAPSRTGNLTTTATVGSVTPDPVASNNTVTRAFVIAAP